VPGEFGAFGPHPAFEICDQRCDTGAANGEALAGRQTVDLALDVEDRIDALDRLER
jgi:hypothetical protein